MSNKETYPNWNRIYGFLSNSTYGFYNAETAEKIKLKGQEILKELLQKRLNQNKEDE